MALLRTRNADHPKPSIILFGPDTPLYLCGATSTTLGLAPAQAETRTDRACLFFLSEGPWPTSKMRPESERGLIRTRQTRHSQYTYVRD